MASPMSFFRRYQRGLMAFFGVILMVIFLVGMVVPDFRSGMAGGGNSSQTNPVVVKWKDGQMTRRDLDIMGFQYFQTQRFLEELYKFAVQKTGENFRPAAMPLINVPDPGNTDPASIDQVLLSKRILMQMAKKEGLIVSDAMVEDYFMLLTKNTELTKAELEKLASDATNSQMDFQQIREHLKEELAAQQMSNLRSAGLSFVAQRLPSGEISYAPSPTEAIQFFARSKAAMTAEIVPIPVSDYLAKVTDSPSNAEMRKLFDQGKYEFFDDTYKSPGFKIPRRMNVQYFVADQNQFLEMEMAKVSDKELQEEYDRLVKAEDPLVVELIPETDPSLTPEGQPKTEDAPKPAGEAAPDPAANTKNDDDVKPETKSEADKKSETEKSADDGAAEKKSDDPPKGGQSQIQSAPGSEYFVSASSATQDQEKSADEAEKKQETTDEKKSESAEKAADPPVTQDTKSADPSVQSATGSTDELPKEKKRIRPLKDVEKDVRRNLKAKTAQEALTKALEEAGLAVRDYQSKLADAESAADEKQVKFDVDNFPKFDGTEVAKKFNLKFEQTGVVDLVGLQKSEIGKANFFIREMGRLIPGSTIVAARFSQMNLYEPDDPQYSFMDQKFYVFWLAEKKFEEIPKFEDVSDKIVEYWKRQKAFEAAMTDAKRFAEEANSSKKPLSEKYGEKAKPTGEFSWYSSSMNFGLSQPAGVDNPGEDFMESVFALSENECGVAYNLLRDTVYVVRVISKANRSSEDLNKLFITEVSKFQEMPVDVQSVAESYSQQLFDDWSEEFRKEMNIQWIAH